MAQVSSPRRLASSRPASTLGDEPLVEIALVEPVAVGDTLLVHAGTAIA